MHVLLKPYSESGTITLAILEARAVGPLDLPTRPQESDLEQLPDSGFPEHLARVWQGARLKRPLHAACACMWLYICVYTYICMYLLTVCSFLYTYVHVQVYVCAQYGYTHMYVGM